LVSTNSLNDSTLNDNSYVERNLRKKDFIFSYDIINTFLEHAGKVQSWNYRDIQHAPLALTFLLTSTRPF